MRAQTAKLILIILLSFFINPLNAQNMSQQDISIFPIGEENPPENSPYFIGQSYLSTLSDQKELNSLIYNVTFEPSCRNNWHKHKGGQILIAISGSGFYQEQGKPARPLSQGDVVEIMPDIVHWHGAAPDSWFSHLAIQCNPQINKTTWLDPVDDKEYKQATLVKESHSERPAHNYYKWFPVEPTTLAITDPELNEIFTRFAFTEVQEYGNLDIRTRILVTMVSTIAQNSVKEYRKMLYAAYSNGISPVEIKEVLYHTVPYVGMSQAANMVDVMNEFLTERGVKLPLQMQAASSSKIRMERGLSLQKSIFGDQIDKLYETSPDNQLHIQKFLSTNCFGDYQTRSALDVKIRELLTFSILISLGGCEPQVKAHIQGNVNVGNDKKTLLTVVTQLLPYIGYPRTLNAIANLNEIIPENQI